MEERAIVMELVDGARWTGPLPGDSAFDHARQIAVALEAAPRKGIVHCDRKPANIKITPDGIVKVVDFGLGKIERRGARFRRREHLADHNDVAGARRMDFVPPHGATMWMLCSYSSRNASIGCRRDARQAGP